MLTKTCDRCDGRGQIPRYGHHAEGVCFRCGGTGSIQAKSQPTSKIEAADAETPNDHKIDLSFMYD